MDFVRATAARLSSSGHGLRGQILREAADTLGCSVQAFYEKLRKHAGWTSGRKLRADRGDSRISLDEVKAIAGIMSASGRANNKRLIDTKNAISIGRANGLVTADASEQTVRRIMRRHGIHPTQLARATPYTSMRSEHPNQVWQLDASLCVLYYLRNGTVAVMDEAVFYKNKPQNVAAIENRRMLRYLVTDHTTCSFFLRYFHVAGEDQATLFEFLMEAMLERPGVVMHGVPFNLIWDAGAANQAHAIKNLLDALAIRHWTHVPGNPRAKGQVERMHDVVEHEFEGRLAFMQITSLEQLNAAADVWQRDYCGREIHSRHGHTRWGLWQTIAPEQLRICPPREVCQSLLFCKPEPRTVKGNLTVQFRVKGYDSAFYSVDHVPRVRVGEQLLVTVNPYRAPSVFLIAQDEHGATRYYESAPLGRDKAGFFLDAPVLGEGYKSHAETDVDTARKDLREAAYGTRDQNEADALKRKGMPAYGGAIDPMKDLRDRAASVPDHMKRRGTALDVPSPVQLEEKPLDVTEALFQLRQRLGRVITRDEAAQIRADYPGGVPETELEAIAARLSAPVAPERPRLVAIK